jgi:HEAT repeat protein
MIKGPESFEPLRQALLFDTSKNVRMDAAVALGAIGEDRAVAPLIEAYCKAKASESSSPDVGLRRMLIEALSNFHTREVVNLLAESAKDESSIVQYCSVLALRKNTEDPKVQRVLIRTLEQSPRSEVAACAAESLGVVGGHMAISPLLRAAGHNNKRIQDAAKAALEEIRKRTGLEIAEQEEPQNHDDNSPGGVQIRATGPLSSETWSDADLLRPCFREETEPRNMRTVPGLSAVAHLGNNKEYAGAIESAENLLEQYQDLDFLYLWLGICHLGLQDQAKAKSILLKGLEKSRSKAYLCCKLGEVEWANENAKQALGWWCQSIHCHESNPHDLDNSPYLYLAAIAGAYGLKREYDAFSLRAHGIRNADLSSDAMSRLQKLFIQQKSPAIESAVKGICKLYLMGQN